jgi:hypothetical protein
MATVSGIGEWIHVCIKSLPTIFPLLIDKIEYFIIIVIKNCVSRFAHFLKLLSTHYLLLIHDSPTLLTENREVDEEASNIDKRFQLPFTTYLSDPICR